LSNRLGRAAQIRIFSNGERIGISPTADSEEPFDMLNPGGRDVMIGCWFMLAIELGAVGCAKSGCIRCAHYMPWRAISNERGRSQQL